MPTKRTPISRVPVQLGEDDWFYLTDRIRCRLSGKGDDVELWARWRDVVLEYWVREHPGTRPRLWWNHDAPRQPSGRWPGAWFDGQLVEPRRRLGGTGTPAWEALSYAPCYDHGIPAAWITADLARHFKLAVPAYDPLDPPRFETELAYLRRHGLLLPGEQ